MKVHLSILLLCCLALSVASKESEEDTPEQKESWWSGFKTRVKTVMSRWRDDLRALWDDVLAKAQDMRSWSSDMFEGLKKKMREWVETRPEVPDDEKNEIETFISRLKVPPPSEGAPKKMDP